MEVLVLSCDKYIDLAYPFHHCMEKYWKNHPEITYMMNTIENPYYKTVCVDYPLSQWTRRVREALNTIEDNKILIMVDDCFIREPVDENRIKYACSWINENENTAFINFEKSFDVNDEDCKYTGFKKRKHNSAYEVSVMCGLWNKDKLLDVLSEDMSPWDVELTQPNRGYDYYVNSGDYLINWGYATSVPFGVFRGKWCKEAILFFDKEGITVDYSKRGVW